jgi:hypothetical protein
VGSEEESKLITFAAQRALSGAEPVFRNVKNVPFANEARARSKGLVARVFRGCEALFLYN